MRTPRRGSDARNQRRRTWRRKHAFTGLLIFERERHSEVGTHEQRTDTFGRIVRNTLHYSLDRNRSRTF